GAIDAGACDVSLQTGSLDDGAIAFRKFFAELIDVRVVFTRKNIAKRGEARGHGRAIRVVRAAVKDFVLSDQIHHGTARAECGERQAAADGFRQADYVRLNAEVFAGAAPRQFRSCFYFVEDKQRAVFRGDLAQALQETRLWHAEPDIHQNRFQNNCGNLSRILTEAALDAREVIERCDNHVGKRSFWHPSSAGDGVGRVGISVFLGLRLNADQSRVMQSVVGAFEL